MTSHWLVKEVVEVESSKLSWFIPLCSKQTVYVYISFCSSERVLSRGSIVQLIYATLFFSLTSLSKCFATNAAKAESYWGASRQWLLQTKTGTVIRPPSCHVQTDQTWEGKMWSNWQITSWTRNLDIIPEHLVKHVKWLSTKRGWNLNWTTRSWDVIKYNRKQ